MTSIQYPLAVGPFQTRVIEAGSGPVVVFLHGLGARADRWRATVERIASQGRRAIAFDLPGHGLASRNADNPATVPEIAQFVLQTLDTLGVTRAVLVGTSLGAHIAAFAATLAPERVPGLCLVGALGIVPIEQIVAETIARNVCAQDRALFAGKLRFVLHDPDSVTEAMIEEEWRCNTLPGTVEGFTQIGDYLVNGIAADYVAERIRAQFSPADLLVIWGAEDKAVPLSVGRACEAALGNPEFVVIENSNHVPYGEQPGAFDAALLPFLARLE